ncbi:hypothetical protein VTI74DRAFT_1789 [Chaetomium olivicolor]
MIQLDSRTPTGPAIASGDNTKLRNRLDRWRTANPPGSSHDFPAAGSPHQSAPADSRMCLDREVGREKRSTLRGAAAQPTSQAGRCYPTQRSRCHCERPQGVDKKGHPFEPSVVDRIRKAVRGIIEWLDSGPYLKAATLTHIAKASLTQPYSKCNDGVPPGCLRFTGKMTPDVRLTGTRAS